MLHCERIGTYYIESLQIYFPGSLELQEELINAGFEVPKPTPLPIIYANFRGWVAKKPPITIERLIHPSRYGRKPSDLGWTETTREGKEAYIIPDEKSLLHVEFDDEKREIHLAIEPQDYHIERTSIRQVGPEKWTNWAMFYLNLRDLADLTRRLLQRVRLSPEICKSPLYIRKETLQAGKEETYFYRLTRGDVGLPIKDFSFCMGCFDQVLDYLASEIGDRNAVSNLRLRLNYSPEIGGFAKIGLARIEGKNPQFMFKLASYPIERAIRGLLKDRIYGKARGRLSRCQHERKVHYVTLDSEVFLRALCCSRNLAYGITLKGRDCRRCYAKFRIPSWLRELAPR